MNLLTKKINNLLNPENSLRNEKGAIGLIAVVLLIIGIIVGVYLVQTRTNLLPKAFDSTSGPVVNYPFGKAAKLNNPNPFVATGAAYLTKSNANLIMGSPFTIEGWIKTPKPTSGNSSKPYNLFSYGEPFYAVFNITLEVQDSNGYARPSFRFRTVEGGGLNGEICCGVTESKGLYFTPDAWHHLAITMISEPGASGGANLCKSKIYMDGVLAGSAEQYVANCNISFANNKTLTFGAPLPGTGGAGAVYYPGELDEFRISKTLRYKENFTPSKLPFPNNDDLTQALWHFDDNTQDAKGINHLQPLGTVTFNDSTIVAPGVVTTPGPSSTPAPVQKTASLKLGSSMTGNIGQQFSIPIIFSSHIDPVNLVSAQLNYPADKLDVVDISVDTTNFNNTFEKYFGNGQVSIILGNTTGVKTPDPNAGTIIAKVIFKTKAAGVSDITFNKQASKMLRVGDSANIYNPDNSNSATITVTTAPTPAPTPIGTPGPSVAFRVVPYCRTDGNLVNRIEHKWVQGSWANTIYRNPPYATYGESIDVGWARDGFTDPYEDGNGIQFNTTYTYRLGTGDGVIHGPVTVTTPAKCDGNLPPGGKITDLSSCTVIRGYACDKTDLSKPTQVNFYADGLADNGGISIGSTIANLAPPSTFNSGTDFYFSGMCGTGGFFDPPKPVFFEFPVPNSIKDGKTHKIYAHAINNPAGYNKPLNGPVTSDMLGTGNNIKCAPPATPVPTPFPPTPAPTPSTAPTPAPTPTVSPCQLTKAEWVLGSNPAQSNTTAGLRVEATGACTNQQVTFSVREDDGVLGSDPVTTNPQPSILVANSNQSIYVATTTWITEFQEDGFFGANNPPEYQFTATVGTSPAIMVSGNPLLQVLRAAGTPSPVEGDINNDKTVDLGDLSWLLTNWGPIKGNELIDYNNDGVINNFDISAEVAILKQKGILRSQ